MTLIRHRLLIPEGSAELVRGVMREAKRCLGNEQKFDASYSHKGTHTAHQGRHWGLEVDLRVS